jgi:hypothetical protein
MAAIVDASERDGDSTSTPPSRCQAQPIVARRGWREDLLCASAANSIVLFRGAQVSVCRMHEKAYVRWGVGAEENAALFWGWPVDGVALGTRERAEASRRRDQRVGARTATAIGRDHAAALRDMAAQERDETARRRDETARLREETTDRGANRQQMLSRARQDRERAAADRERAAEDRARSAADRQAAARVARRVGP